MREQIQADGRLVQEDQARLMDQRGDQFHLHALAQREAAHLHVEQVFHIQQLGQLAQGGFIGRVVDLVDALVQVQQLVGRQVPPQLVLLPHHDGELHLEGFLALPGGKAQHVRFAAAGVQNAREHLQRGGLARPIGAQETHHLALFDLEGNPAHRFFGQLFAEEQVPQRILQPEFFLIIVKRLGKVLYRDNHNVTPQEKDHPGMAAKLYEWI